MGQSRSRRNRLALTGRSHRRAGRHAGLAGAGQAVGRRSGNRARGDQAVEAAQCGGGGQAQRPHAAHLPTIRARTRSCSSWAPGRRSGRTSGNLPEGKAAARAAARAPARHGDGQPDRVINSAAERHPGALPYAHRAQRGIAVRADATQPRAIKRIYGRQRRSTRSPPKKPTTSTPSRSSVATTPGTDLGNRGANTTIAIIDTGLDYTHANFGGPGTVEAYDARARSRGRAGRPGALPERQDHRRLRLRRRRVRRERRRAEPRVPAPGPEPARLQRPRQPRRWHRSRLRRQRATARRTTVTYDVDHAVRRP